MMQLNGCLYETISGPRSLPPSDASEMQVTYADFYGGYMMKAQIEASIKAV